MLTIYNFEEKTKKYIGSMSIIYMKEIILLGSKNYAKYILDDKFYHKLIKSKDIIDIIKTSIPYDFKTKRFDQFKSDIGYNTRSRSRLYQKVGRVWCILKPFLYDSMELARMQQDGDEWQKFILEQADGDEHKLWNILNVNNNAEALKLLKEHTPKTNNPKFYTHNLYDMMNEDVLNILLQNYVFDLTQLYWADLYWFINIPGMKYSTFYYIRSIMHKLNIPMIEEVKTCNLQRWKTLQPNKLTVGPPSREKFRYRLLPGLIILK